jgi:hypothetical protein
VDYTFLGIPMQFRILGCPDKDFKPFVLEAAQFFSQELITNTRIRNNCQITIKFTSKIKEYGYASIKSFNSRKMPRKFLIELHSGIGARRIFETLAHEMVHIKQYIMNETNDSLTVWRGKSINSEKVDYWDHPWEIDAFGREPGLLYKFAVNNCLWEIFPEFKNPDSPIEIIPIEWK